MKKAGLILIFAVLFLIANSLFCSAAPGAIENFGMSYLNSGYAAPVDFFNSNSPIFYLNSENFVLTNDNQIVNLSINASLSRGYVYKLGWIWNSRLGDWIPFQFDNPGVSGSYWINGSESISKTLSINAKNNLENGLNFIAVFSCKKYNNQWKCGCDSANDVSCNKWSLLAFNVSNANWTESPAQRCTLDNQCNQNLGEQCRANVCSVVSCINDGGCSNHERCVGGVCKTTFNSPIIIRGSRNISLNSIYPGYTALALLREIGSIIQLDYRDLYDKNPTGYPCTSLGRYNSSTHSYDYRSFLSGIDFSIEPYENYYLNCTTAKQYNFVWNPNAGFPVFGRQCSLDKECTFFDPENGGFYSGACDSDFASGGTIKRCHYFVNGCIFNSTLEILDNSYVCNGDAKIQCLNSTFGNLQPCSLGCNNGFCNDPQVINYTFTFQKNRMKYIFALPINPRSNSLNEILSRLNIPETEEPAFFFWDSARGQYNSYIYLLEFGRRFIYDSDTGGSSNVEFYPGQAMWFIFSSDTTVNQDINFTIIGTPITSPIPITIGGGWQMMSIPYNYQYYNASRVLRELNILTNNKCYSFYQYNWTAEGYNIFWSNNTGVDFQIRNDEGYWLNCNKTVAGTIWTPTSV